ncbi:ribonuclease H-like domain-containing protein [Dethiosulfatarculus sandiegensis]|nr:ribonuclease H-like domain-containing protein [Dethiosulfatarculus sandiegensis]
MLWQAGINTWRDFMQKGPELLSPRIFGLGKPVIKRSLAALASPAGLSELAKMIPAREQWRFYPHFAKVVFLDIETGFNALEWGGITVVGLYDGNKVEQFISGRNLNEVRHALRGYDIVCTFSGTSFDLPVLKKVFSDIYLPPAHIDLRWVLKRLGYTGGLKRIEKEFGLDRPADVRDMDGLEAVRLWQAHEKGDPDALALLCEYNACDILNLKPLLEFSVSELEKRLMARAGLTG